MWLRFFFMFQVILLEQIYFIFLADITPTFVCIWKYFEVATFRFSFYDNKQIKRHIYIYRQPGECSLNCLNTWLYHGLQFTLVIIETSLFLSTFLI